MPKLSKKGKYTRLESKSSKGKNLKIVEVIEENSLLGYNYNEQFELLIHIIKMHWKILRIEIKSNRILMYCNKSQPIFNHKLEFKINKRLLKILKHMFKMLESFEKKCIDPKKIR
ncbi:hypothetical protein A0H76_810 [Hepatospora eriocheir]|uniref:Uncharacterized protein n=1 Tax=Hepatospora eriocheir TaxID=1081669 RepID=A0A1X0Q6P1_9MICR|nr:hypothetical protein A0H76_810 [Hepatospora eriocheir]